MVTTTDLLDVAITELVPDADPAVEPRLEPVDYASGSPATAALHRVRGTTVDGEPWTRFVKLLQHVRHWPQLSLLPPPVAEQFKEQFPWRAELHLWSELTQATLPPGLRAPVLHRLVELPDDRVVVWMEDVDHAEPRGLATFARAAHLLGRWNARSTSPDVLAATGFRDGHGLRMYAEHSVPLRGLGPLEDDGLWSHPWLVDHDDLRARLRALGRQIPTMLDRLDALPQCVPHGDASLQNLLIPADPDDPVGPDGFVVIDLSFTTPHALGFDLGQLMVGLTHADQVPASMLPAIAETIEPAYLAGLAEEGLTGVDAAVRDGFTTSLLLRSGLDSFRLDLLGQLDAPEAERAEARRLFAERVALADVVSQRYLDAHP